MREESPVRPSTGPKAPSRPSSARYNERRIYTIEGWGERRKAVANELLHCLECYYCEFTLYIDAKGIDILRRYEMLDVGEILNCFEYSDLQEVQNRFEKGTWGKA